MSNKSMPKTSRDAFHSLDPAKINEIHKKILAALEVLGVGTFEDVAEYLHLDRERIWRRMAELGSAHLIHRPGERKIMKSGRQGMVWKLGDHPDAVAKKKRIKKEKTVADYSRAILNQVKPSEKIQQTLF